ncbi:hypothetical protein H696_05795 [Fonticula alba]|uniref:ABC transporter domain-containing protein n=1 Tax=Fonticula alba TaxID=691883 RepID=A0A058Z0A3_FONAL|nr:hypothetical protein H696_05795 [Fonticula alba]KCV67685.1 hypothetical protein H696_05795 [Fonticula alba]|eukprot:XP_009497869.1 hypothetical protein H696_05795 [Fonticula alba]
MAAEVLLASADSGPARLLGRLVRALQARARVLVIPRPGRAGGMALAFPRGSGARVSRLLRAFARTPTGRALNWVAQHPRTIISFVVLVRLVWQRYMRKRQRDSMQPDAGAKEPAAPDAPGPGQPAAPRPSSPLRLLQIVFPGLFSRSTLLLALLTGSLAARTALSVYVAGLDGRLVRGLVARRPREVGIGLAQWLGVGIPAALVNASIRFFQSRLASEFRKLLTDHLQGLYMSGQVYYAVTQLDDRLCGAGAGAAAPVAGRPGHAAPRPDAKGPASDPAKPAGRRRAAAAAATAAATMEQRLVGDVVALADSLSSVYGDVAKPLFDMWLFARKLETSLGATPFGLMWWSYLFTAAVIHVSAPDFAAHHVALSGAEGDFRHAYSRLATHAEEIAFYSGEPAERRTVAQAWRRVQQVLHRFHIQRIRFHFTENLLVRYIWTALGLVAQAIPVFFSSAPGGRSTSDVAVAAATAAAAGTMAALSASGGTEDRPLAGLAGDVAAGLVAGLATASAPSAENAATRTEAYMTSKNMMSNLADAGGRLMYAYQDLAELYARSLRVNSLLTVLEEVAADRPVRSLATGPFPMSNRRGRVLVLDRSDPDRLAGRSGSCHDTAPGAGAGAAGRATGSVLAGAAEVGPGAAVDSPARSPADCPSGLPPAEVIAKSADKVITAAGPLVGEPTAPQEDALGREIHYSLKRVPVVTPTGELLIEPLTLDIRQGRHLLITGPNASGKTSLLRVLSGLWPVYDGLMITPHPRDVFFVTQKPYLCPGNLRDQIIYPDTRHDMVKKGFTDAYLQEILTAAFLAYLPEREGGFDSVRTWGNVLSGGERQRLNIARVYYHRPLFAIMDECTSAVSLDVEAALFQRAMQAALPAAQTTLVAVTQRPGVLAPLFKDRLTIGEDGPGSWSLLSAEGARRSGTKSFADLRKYYPGDVPAGGRAIGGGPFADGKGTPLPPPPPAIGPRRQEAAIIGSPRLAPIPEGPDREDPAQDSDMEFLFLSSVSDSFTGLSSSREGIDSGEELALAGVPSSRMDLAPAGVPSSRLDLAPADWPADLPTDEAGLARRVQEIHDQLNAINSQLMSGPPPEPV